MATVTLALVDGSRISVVGVVVSTHQLEFFAGISEVGHTVCGFFTVDWEYSVSSALPDSWVVGLT
jgi:hypothetical protein